MDQDDSVNITARGSGCEGDDFYRVSFLAGGVRQERYISSVALSSNSEMRKIGILTTTSRSAISARAEEATRTMPSTFEVADRSGWFNRTFVWPDGAFTGEEVPICLATEYRGVPAMRHTGTLQDWRVIGDLARGNDRVMLIIAHAFTGPVAHFLGLEAPAIQLVGEAGVFKSSIADVIASFWGTSRKSWHQTDYEIEQVALRHHATHLVLDDFRVDKKHSYADLRAIAIRLLDGQTKGRMGDGARWYCTPILSTSNRSLDEHARLAGLPNDADQAAIRGRLIDVPIGGERAVMFDDLHGRASGLDFMVDLSDVARDNRGARRSSSFCAYAG